MVSLPHPPLALASVALSALAVAACAGRTNAPETSQSPYTTASAGGETAKSGPAITPEDLRRRLFAFSDDSMMGREAGTVGNVKATDYIAREAAKLGLRPAGENGTFFQTVPLINRAMDPASTLTVDGAPLTYRQDYVMLPAFGGVFGAQFQSAGGPAVYGGRLGDTVVTRDQVAGKLVVFDAPLDPSGKPTPQFRAALGALARYDRAAGWAIATLDIANPGTISFLTHPQATVKGSEATGGPERPAGFVISQAAARHIMGAALITLSPGAAGHAVAGHVRTIEQPSTAPARNVVAILPGAEPTLRGEYVALGGHSDHLGVADHAVDHDSARTALTAAWRLRGLDPTGPRPTAEQLAAIDINVDSLHRLRPPRRDSVFNGADDDGSGAISVLELAQAFTRATPRPRRSILFVWHTGEEKGLLGSQYFTDSPTVPRDSIVAQLNMDMVGRGDSADIKGGGPLYVELVGSRRLSTELGDIVEAVNKTEPQPLVFDYQFDANGHPENIYCRSDHYEYARYGIPIVFFTTGLHEDYHQLTDEAQYIDYPHMARVDRLVYDVATRVANLDHRVVVDKPKPDPHGQCRQ